MSDGFDHIFLTHEETQPEPSPQANKEVQEPMATKPEEDYYDYDGPVFPKLNPMQITLIVITLLMLVGFGVFYAHRTSAQKNDASTSTLTPIPTQTLSAPTDAPVVIPSQTTDLQNTDTNTTPQTDEGGQPIAPDPTSTPVPAATATPTPTTSQPTPTATSAPTATPTSTPTPTPTDTPTATPTP